MSVFVKSWKIRSKLFLATACMVMGCIAVSTWLAWTRGRTNLEQRLSRELLAAVNTLATQIDGDLHEVVRSDDQGEIVNLDEFEVIRSQLLRVEKALALRQNGSPVYTLRPTAEFPTTRDMEFVVMTHPDPVTQRYFTGNHYRALPHLILAFQGTPTATGLYSDGEGTWISAAAPIRSHETGQIVAVVQMDRTVQEVYAEARTEALSVMGTSLIVLAASLAAAAWFAKRFTRPIQNLAQSTKLLAAGHLETRTHWDSGDEFGELVDHFNSMAEKLQTARSESEKHHNAITEACERVRAELTQEQALRLETSRRLGRAEVAIGVLHHLGNALNSAKVSSGQLEQLVAHLPTHSLQKLAQLFQEQGDSLGDFLSDKAKRGQLIPYVIGLSEKLNQGQSSLHKEVADLQQHLASVEALVTEHRAYTNTYTDTDKSP